jgi:hypothetical protein
MGRITALVTLMPKNAFRILGSIMAVLQNISFYSGIKTM